MKFNGVIYTYLPNLQGDVVGLLDSSGTLVVEYKYDAWGKLMDTRTLTNAYEPLSKCNSFRYREYVCDEEIWMYWIKSRYYDPKLCRFINVDLILGNIGSALTHNAWAYCYNKPTVLVDPEG